MDIVNILLALFFSVVVLVYVVITQRKINELNAKVKVLEVQNHALERIIASRQRNMRVRKRADETTPEIKRPKVDQPYVGKGVRPEGETSATSIGTVKRHWSGGKERDSSDS